MFVHIVSFCVYAAGHQHASIDNLCGAQPDVTATVETYLHVMGKDKSSKKDRKDKKRKRDKEDEEDHRKAKAEKLVSGPLYSLNCSQQKHCAVARHANCLLPLTSHAQHQQASLKLQTWTALHVLQWCIASSCRQKRLPVTSKSIAAVMATLIKTTRLGTAMSQSASYGARNSKSRFSQEWMLRTSVPKQRSAGRRSAWYELLHH